MLEDELNKINTTAQDIKTAITDKGQTVESTDVWADLPSKIDAIKSYVIPYNNIMEGVIEGTIININDNTLKYIRPNCFRNCFSLKKARFENIGKICMFSFYSCNHLEMLILPGNFVKLDNINAFKNTPLDRLEGSIYVNDDILQEYQNDKTWSRYKSIIKPLSQLDTNSIG